MNKLICPTCLNKFKEENILQKTNKSAICKKNHTFDYSKEGYLNLLNSKTGSGDNDLLISARESFLLKDYYKPLRDYICDLLKQHNISSVVDCGCGTGYYTEAFSDIAPHTYGIDISKTAIKNAAKKHNRNKNINYFVSSCNNIPLQSNSIDCIINIFAPYFDKEFNRILKQNKYLITATCNKSHLFELKEMVYDTPYYNENVSKETSVLESFSLLSEYDLTYKINVNNEDLINLFMMTPYYYKTKENDFNKLKEITNLEITISFKISLFQKVQNNF